MQTIHASNQLTIELSPTTWRLMNGSQPSDLSATRPTLVEARQDGIYCSGDFCRARDLPEDGPLAPEDITRVVLGWAPETQNWHLGLMLAPPSDSGEKMRWCGLASWPSSPVDDYLEEATAAGQALAEVIARPFHVVPPPAQPALAPRPEPVPETQPIEITEQMAPAEAFSPDIAPQDPPFKFENWELIAVPGGLVWQRRGRWVVAMAFRAAALIALALLFVIMSVGSQVSGLAGVNPEWLPWVGLGVAVVMAITAVRNFTDLLNITNILMDTTRREVRCQGRFSTRVKWSLAFDSVDFVLLSQTSPRPLGKARDDGAMRTAQDVWLYLYDGDQFWPVVTLGRVDGKSHTWESIRALQKQPGRRALRLADYDTPAHHAAHAMSRTIETGLWLDII